MLFGSREPLNGMGPTVWGPTGAYSLGAYGCLESQATSFGNLEKTDPSWGQTLETNSLRTLQSRTTDFGSHKPLIGLAKKLGASLV